MNNNNLAQEIRSYKAQQKVCCPIKESEWRIGCLFFAGLKKIQFTKIFYYTGLFTVRSDHCACRVVSHAGLGMKYCKDPFVA